MKKLNELTIHESIEGLKKGEFSSVQITEACLNQIRNVDKKIKALITLNSNSALEEAKKAENEKKVQEYQTSLNSLQQDYNTYAQYAQSLESDLAYAQQNGEDTADIQSQIDTNNQMLSSLQQQITYYQQQISALQS